jgi:hypothetical protein
MASENRPDATRRTVVRTAATAAWTAPVIVAASAAPVYAATPSAAVLQAPAPTVSLLGNAITIRSSYQNLGTGPADSMSVTVTVTATVGSITASEPVMENDTFAFVSQSGNATERVYTFVKVAPQIAAGDDATLAFTYAHIAAPGTSQRAATVSLAPVVPPPSTAQATSGNYTSSEQPGNTADAAVLVSPYLATFRTTPTTMELACNWRNLGTGTSPSMDVVVTLTASVGTLTMDPIAMNNNAFELVDRVQSSGSQMVLTFAKVDPQIPVDGNSTLDFEFGFTPLAGVRAIEANVVPSVPAPHSATASYRSLPG